MTSLTNPCPFCEQPIADTAYICAGCTRHLRARLRWIAALLEQGQLDLTIGRHTRTHLGIIEPRPVDRAIYAGPWCYGGGHDCGHDSCRLVWFSIITQRIEDPLPHEDAGVINLGGSDTRDIIDDTARAWADFVHDQRGATIPAVRAAPLELEHLHTLEDNQARHRGVRRCVYSDLPIPQCGCGRTHQEDR